MPIQLSPIVEHPLSSPPPHYISYEPCVGDPPAGSREPNDSYRPMPPLTVPPRPDAPSASPPANFVPNQTYGASTYGDHFFENSAGAPLFTAAPIVVDHFPSFAPPN